jgi:hypothetical protein
MTGSAAATSGDCLRARRLLRARRWRDGEILALVVLRTTLPIFALVMARIISSMLKAFSINPSEL